MMPWCSLTDIFGQGLFVLTLNKIYSLTDSKWQQNKKNC